MKTAVSNSLLVKQFFYLFLPLLALLILIFAFFFQSKRHFALEQIKHDESASLALQIQFINQSSKSILFDLTNLTNLASSSLGADESEKVLEKLAELLVLKQLYKSAVLLGPDKSYAINLVEDNKYFISPIENSNRFASLRKLTPGQIYVSTTRDEEKLTMLFASRAGQQEQYTIGLFVNSQQFFNQSQVVAQQNLGLSMLLSQTGEYLLLLDNQSLGYQPADIQSSSVWNQIVSRPSGQVLTSEGLFTHQVINPIPKALFSELNQVNDFTWRLVSRIPKTTVSLITNNHLMQQLQIASLLLITLIIACYFLAKLNVQRKLAERKAEINNEKINAIVNTARDAILSFNHLGQINYCNYSAEKLFSYQKTDLIGLKITSLIPELPKNIDKLINFDQDISNELTGKKANGSEFTIEASISNYTLTDKKSSTIIVRDVTDRKQLENKLKLLATTDELTKVYNRSYFVKRLNEEYQRANRYGQPLSLAMIDIDFFKEINDNHGHLAGDAFLSGMAQLIKDTIRNVDVLSRYGGEEFALIMPHTSANNAQYLAERLRQASEAFQISYEGFIIKRTLSIGIANLTSSETLNEQELIKLADDALYEAKNSGRNRVRVA